MSLFFGRISKLSEAGREKSRFFSSSPHFPCLLLNSFIVRESPKGNILSFRVFDAAKEEAVCSSKRKAPRDLHNQIFKGASQGWFAAMNTKYGTIHLTNLYKPWVSSPRVISLPPLGLTRSTLCHTRVSLSSDPSQETDFCVAAKFSNYQLSLCRPCCGDSKWTQIDARLSPTSELMYSKRDKTFYFTTSKSLRMGVLDPNFNNEVKYKNIRLRNLPKITHSGREMLNKCLMSNHLVESPSGQRFFIQWYSKCSRQECTHEDVETCSIRPRRFMVFREDDEKSYNYCYTEDIGDLCIFLSNSEPFCLSASMYPGLKPNSIYYTSMLVGYYNLTSGTICDLSPFEVDACYWLHPTDHILKKDAEKEITLLARGSTQPTCYDIINDSYIHRFRSIRSLRVKDLLGPERCEKKIGNSILLDERKTSKAMELGQARQEVVERVMQKLISKSWELEEEVVEKITKKFNKLEVLEEEVVEKITKKFNLDQVLKVVVAEKVTQFIGQDLEEVDEKVTRKFNEFEELEVESSEKVSKFKELEKEVVENSWKKFRDLQLRGESYQKLTRPYQPSLNN